MIRHAIALAMAFSSVAAAAQTPPAPAKEPVFAARQLYAPGHFGNSYEALGEREMRAVLEEARQWGFNSYADWFDVVNCTEPYSDRFLGLAKATLDRKKAHFRSAQALGLPCTLVITPNHVYLDQCRPEWAATKTERIFGQLICPSKPEARAIILQDFDNLFRDLAESGVHLSALAPGPYDYGGCACEACQPWILTWAKLCREIHAIALKYHPGIEMHCIGWWWSAEEHRLFAEWADREAPGWVKSMSLHIPYEQIDVADVPLPKGCERRAFVHIGYAETNNPEDIYAQLGPVIAATRIEKTIAALKARGCTGWMAYSEGVFDDVNKAILAGVSSGAYATADDVLAAYARRYFAADDARAQAWSAWLKQWGKAYDVDADVATAALAKLREGAPASWRLRQWELKDDLMRYNAAIMREQEWTPTRLANVESFLATREKLDREVYGVGVELYVLNWRGLATPWFESWMKYTAAQIQAKRAGQ